MAENTGYDAVTEALRLANEKTAPIRDAVREYRKQGINAMTANPCPHARSAAEFITSRAIMGREKYGHTLADAALSPAALVRHAREEAADQAVYLTALEAALSWQPIETAPKGRIEGVIQYVILCARYPGTNQQTDCIQSWWDGQGWARWHHTFPPTLWIALPPLSEAKPEPTRPAVTREAVMRSLVSCGAAECSREYEHCSRGNQCTCRMRVDAIMTLIGDAP